MRTVHREHPVSKELVDHVKNLTCEFCGLPRAYTYTGLRAPAVKPPPEAVAGPKPPPESFGGPVVSELKVHLSEAFLEGLLGDPALGRKKLKDLKGKSSLLFSLILEMEAVDKNERRIEAIAAVVEEIRSLVEDVRESWSREEHMRKLIESGKLADFYPDEKIKALEQEVVRLRTYLEERGEA